MCIAVGIAHAFGRQGDKEEGGSCRYAVAVGGEVVGALFVVLYPRPCLKRAPS
jgi:hypothetical protein